MAKADKTTVSVTKVVEEEGYTLSLTKEEAGVLNLVCAFIGGPADKTARGHTDAIATALRNAGIPHYSANPNYGKLSGSIEFS